MIFTKSGNVEALAYKYTHIRIIVNVQALTTLAMVSRINQRDNNTNENVTDTYIVQYIEML